MQAFTLLPPRCSAPCVRSVSGSERKGFPYFGRFLTADKHTSFQASSLCSYRWSTVVRSQAGDINPSSQPSTSGSASQPSSPSPAESEKNATTTTASGSSSAAASTPAGTSAATSTPAFLSQSPWKEIAAAFAAIKAFFASILATAQKLPAWVQAQQLKKLKELSDEDPKNAEKNAAYLVELNKSNPREVIARVDSKEYASNSAVVVEYLKALVATGKLSEYAASSIAPALGDDHRSLSHLLKELQQQVSGEQPDDSPGASLRRPLHVTLQGVNMPQLQKPMGPLQVRYMATHHHAHSPTWMC